MKIKRSALLRLGIGGLALGMPLGAQSFDFEGGMFSGSLDTTLSAGALWRMQDQDDGLLAIANGGTSRSANDDDGNLNYDKGDLVSATIKATHDLELKRDFFGVFTRVTYYYDAQADHDRENFGKRGKDRLVSEFDLLDAFAYFNFKPGGRNLALRFGNQVVNWGESTFIGNSLNVINPFDVAKLRTPGAELKEALLPVPMFWGSYSVTDSVSLEAVWLWAYQETVIDPRGSFFSTNDFLSDDGDFAYAGGGRRNDNNLLDQPLGPTNAPAAIARTDGDRPDGESQQHGVALRYFAEWLNSTEFGLYYLKYHSRVPFFSSLRATDTTSTATRVASARYFAEYPEDIEMYGLSFNTDGPFSIALQGEYSYRPNLPVQLAGVEALLAALKLPNVIDSETSPTNFATSAPGERLNGFRRVKAHQAQMTGTRAFGPTLGAEQFVMIGEAGVTFMELDDDLLYAGPGTTTIPSCRNAGAPVNVIAAVGNGSCQNDTGFQDRTSWGYRLVSRMDFENVIGPVQMSPRLVFAHDVNGVGPAFNESAKALTFGIGFNYLQRWQGDIGYTAFFGGEDYSGTDPIAPGTIILPTPPAVAPTVFAGSANQSADFSTNSNPQKDRDFLAISISYAF